MKKKTKISEQNLIDKLFDRNQVKEIIPLGFKTIQRNKIILFVPESHVEDVFNTMSNAGAGEIGDYKMCSFRSEGIGTYKPVKSSRPFAGKRGIVNYESEIKLEMECDESSLNQVIQSMLEIHPYEEVAYEIYPFFKFSTETNSVLIYLKRAVTLGSILIKLNRKINEHQIKMNLKVRSLVLTDDNDVDIGDADLVIQKSKDKFKIKTIK